MTVSRKCAGTVNILVNDRVAVAKGRSAARILPFLTVNRRRFDARGQCQAHPMPLYMQDEGRVHFPPGLVPFVEGDLACRGYEVRIRKLGRALTDKVCMSVFKRHLDIGDVPFLSAVAGGRLRQRLLARNKKEWGLRVKQLSIHAGSRNASILFVAKNRSDVERCRRLLKADGRTVAHLREPPTGSGPWTAVVTNYLFMSCDFQRWDIVVLVDLETALAKSSVYQLQVWGNEFDCYTLDSGEPRHPEEQKWIAALLGPLVAPSDAESRTTSILVPSPPAPQGTHGSHLDRKRQQFWRHAERNLLIARLANLISRGHCREVVQEGLLSKPQADAVFTAGRRPAVTLLVEGREHGEQLLEQLPRWELLDRREPYPSWPHVPPGCIYTMVTADRKWKGIKGVIIRCDGHSQWPLRRHAIATDAVVIDIAFREALAKHSEAYWQLGWQVVE